MKPRCDVFRKNIYPKPPNGYKRRVIKMEKDKSSVSRNDFTVRTLTTDDVEQYDALLRYAFQVTEQKLKEVGWRDDEIVQAKFPVMERADILGCYDGDQLVSQVAVYPIAMNVYNNVLPIGYVTSVSTYPEYSGRGIMSNLLHQSLVNMRDRGQVLAILYPMSIPLYRKFGWEIISNKISYVIKDRQIPKRKDRAPGYVRRVDWNDKQFKNLHRTFARKTHGCLLRNSAAWDEYWRWDSEDTMVAVYYSNTGKPMGYMVYLLQTDVMYIKEMIYLTREAHNGLWEYIRAHYSMIDEVRGNTYYNEPIAFELEDAAIKETIRPYIMGHIVDVRQFFAKYHCDPKEPTTYIGFETTDNFLDWNNDKFTVKFSKGKCEIVNEHPEYHVKLPVSSLTTLLMGYKTAVQLRKMERLKGSLEAAEALDEVLLHENPYISDFI